MTNIKNLFKGVLVILSFSLFSCSEDSSSDGDGGGAGGNEITSIELSSSSTTTFIGGEVDFSVYSNTNVFVTSSSTFYVDGTAISGSSYSFPTVGQYTVYAKYNDIQSNSITINVNATPTAYVHRLLIEDCTGTWCGWCTRGTLGIETLVAENANIVPVAVHIGDSFQNSTSIAINAILNPSDSFPTIKIERGASWNSLDANTMYLSQVRNSISSSGKEIGLAIDSSVSGTNISIDVEVGFLRDYPDAKLVVYLLEDGIVASQRNYTSNYGGIDPIPDFTHNDILRSSPTSVTGEAIPNSQSVDGNIYSKNINTTTAGLTDVNNCKVVAFVLDEYGNVINAQEAHIGSSVSLEAI